MGCCQHEEMCALAEKYIKEKINLASIKREYEKTFNVEND